MLEQLNTFTSQRMQFPNKETKDKHQKYKRPKSIMSSPKHV